MPKTEVIINSLSKLNMDSVLGLDYSYPEYCTVCVSVHAVWEINVQILCRHDASHSCFAAYMPYLLFNSSSYIFKLPKRVIYVKK